MTNLRFSQRAVEEADELLSQLGSQLSEVGLGVDDVFLVLAGDPERLDVEQVRQWIMESVDQGFPRVGYVVRSPGATVTVEFAAFRASDSDFHP